MTDNTATTSADIIPFPNSRIVNPVSVNEQLNSMKEKGNKNFADDITESISQALMQDFSGYGLETEREDFQKDFIFLVSVLSALIYRNVNLKHDLHTFLDENVQCIKLSDIEEPTH